MLKILRKLKKLKRSFVLLNFLEKTRKFFIAQKRENWERTDWLKAADADGGDWRKE